MFKGIKSKKRTDAAPAAEARPAAADPPLTKLRKEQQQLLQHIRKHNPALTMECVRKRMEYRRAARVAMIDVIDTLSERMARTVHSSPTLNLLEARFKAFAADKSGDAIGALEADVGWGTRWLGIGRMMPLTRPVAAGRPQQLEVQFGRNMRQLYFSLPENGGFIDGSSYGATPLVVQEARLMWDKSCNQTNPVIWRFKSQPFRVRQAEHKLSLLLGSDPDDTKIVLDANNAVCAVLKSLPWEAGDRLLLLSCAGARLKRAAQWVRRNHAVGILECPVALPARSDSILVSAVQDFIEKSGKPYPVLCMLDHVTPREGCLLPVADIRRMLHKMTPGVSLLVDGSLAVGQRDVSAGDVGADWYVGSADQWLYTCPGVGFIIAAPHKHTCTMPLTVSYFDGQGFAKEFEYYGLNCFSTWCATIEALDFPSEVCGGWKDIRKYCNKLALQCCNHIKDKWRCDPVQGKAEHCGMMPVFPLPFGREVPADAEWASRIMVALLQRGITARVYPANLLPGGPQLLIRVTCQIYNDIHDYHRLADAVLEVRKQLRTLPPASQVLGAVPGTAAGRVLLDHSAV